MVPAPQVVLVVAVAHDRVIGAGGKLPWRLPEDLRRFKETTTGHPVVMGRKTFASIGKPLPNRTNIVVTRQAPDLGPGIEVARDPREAVQRGAKLGPRVFVIGGAEVYEATLPLATEILATLVYRAVQGDTFFPALGPEWHLASREDGESASGEPLRFSFARLTRGGARDDGCALCLVRAGKSPPTASPWDAGMRDVLGGLVRR